MLLVSVKRSLFRRGKKTPEQIPANRFKKHFEKAKKKRKLPGSSKNWNVFTSWLLRKWNKNRVANRSGRLSDRLGDVSVAAQRSDAGAFLRVNLCTGSWKVARWRTRSARWSLAIIVWTGVGGDWYPLVAHLDTWRCVWLPVDRNQLGWIRLTNWNSISGRPKEPRTLRTQRSTLAS